MLHRVLDPRRAMDTLRQPSFRWFVLGRICGAASGQLRTVVTGWLVYDMTGSALALGWVTAARSLVTLILSPYGGVIADRFEKRYVIFRARLLLVSTSTILALLFYLGLLQAWHIVVVTMIEGVAFSFMDPAQMVIVSELVQRETLLNAVSLTAVFEGLSGVVGAAVAGGLTVWLGGGSVYLLMALVLALAAYSVLRLPPGLTATGDRTSVRSDLVRGLRYQWSQKALKALLGLFVVMLVLVQPFGTFLPAYSQSVLGLDASGLGLLTAAAAAGALISSFTVASIGNPRHKGGMLVAAAVATAVTVILLVISQHVWAAFVFVALEAAFAKTWDVVAGTLVQTLCDPAYRARMYSVTMVLSGIVSLFMLPAGAVADAIGVPWLLGILALFVLAANVAVAVLQPSVRRMA
jgi:Na+/melibiose symporter-like transporter